MGLALGFDRDLAVAVARRPEGDEGLTRRLWLAIARHAVEGGAAGEDQAACIRGVTQLLEESGGAVRIEDVLPLFPNFVEIDAFKEAICRWGGLLEPCGWVLGWGGCRVPASAHLCSEDWRFPCVGFLAAADMTDAALSLLPYLPARSSLERYNLEIEELKREMASSSRTAQAIREDLARLEVDRAGVVDSAAPCARCAKPLCQPPPSWGGPSGAVVEAPPSLPASPVYCSCLVAKGAVRGDASQAARCPSSSSSPPVTPSTAAACAQRSLRSAPPSSGAASRDWSKASQRWIGRPGVHPRTCCLTCLIDELIRRAPLCPPCHRSCPRAAPPPPRRRCAGRSRRRLGRKTRSVGRWSSETSPRHS